MSSSQQIADEILRLDIESFHGFGAGQASAIAKRLAGLKFQGLAIQAPAEIDVARWSSLPVVVASGRTGLRAWEIDFTQNAIFVAVELESGQVFMGPAHALPEAPSFEEPERRRSRPTRVNAESRSYGVYPFDLRQALDLPWVSGTYAVTLVSYDWISNTVVSRLSGREGPPRATWGHAPLSGAEGIELSMPSGEAVTTAPFPVRAALKIPITSRQIEAAQSGRDPGVRAVVPAAIAVLARDWLLPMRVDLSIQILGDEALTPGQIVEGYAAIDLFERVPAPLSAGDHLLYLVASRHISGPKRIAVTRRGSSPSDTGA